jgi:hypothetical protein
MPHLGHGAHAVVGDGVDDDRRAADAVALVADLLVVDAFEVAGGLVSAGMFAALALSIASRRRGLADASPPPSRAATMMSRMTRVHTLPRFSSCRPLRCWMLAHLE